MYKGTRKALLKHFPKPDIDKLQDESQKEYETLFQELPYIGGSKNSQTINVIMGAIVLSIVRPLEKKGLAKHQIGKVIYDTFNENFMAKPGIIRRIIGRMVTSNLYTGQIKKQIEMSSKREYKEDFVTEYVDAAGKDFDFGYNYTECAIHKLYTKYGAIEYLRYVCLGDYAMFRSLGIGFNRTQTLAHGAPLCDFRFKKKGSTVAGWPPEKLAEWATHQPPPTP